MSKNTAILEAAVGHIRQLMPADGVPQSARQKAAFERAFADLLKLIAPRTRHFIRHYGFSLHVEDAQQCASIALYRALCDYDPEKSQFTTFLNWQIRGELQSLRFRIMKDYRPSTRKTAARTVSLNTSARGPDGEPISLEHLLEDEDAHGRTEAGAADYLAVSAANALIDRYIETQRGAALTAARQRGVPKRQLAGMSATQRRDLQQSRAATFGVDPDEFADIEQKLVMEREVLARKVFGMPRQADSELEELMTKERVRQVTRRAGRALQALIDDDAGFALMAEYRRTLPLDSEAA